MNGSIAQEGRVEVCVDGVWGSVCGNGWTKQAAFVICKQAGYIYSGICLCMYSIIIMITDEYVVFHFYYAI